MTDEPKRLLLSEGGRLGAGLTVARRQVPTDAQMAGLAERLARAGVVLPDDSLRPPPTPEPPPTTPSAEGSSALVKAGLVAIPIVTVGIIALMLRSPSPEPSAIDLRPLAPTAGPNVAAPAHVTNSVSPAPVVAHPANPGARVQQPAAIANTAPEPLPANAAVSSSPLPAAQPALRAAPLAPAGSAPIERQRAASEPRSASRVRSDGAASSAIHADGAPAEQPGVVVRPSEIELLKRARNLLPADPARALAVTEECAREYPRGTFAQERDFIAVSALFRVGRRHEAVTRAERFRATYPKSVFLPQIERMLAAP